MICVRLTTYNMEAITDILFNEAEHKYYDANGHIYTSVTTLIGKYTNTFDTDFWAMYTALKERNFKIKPEPEKQKIYIGGVGYKVATLIKDSTYKHWYAEVLAKWAGLTAEACQRGNAVHNELEDSINLSKGDLLGTTNQLISSNIKGKKGIYTIHDLSQTKLEEKYPQVYQRLSGYIERGFSIFAEKKVHLQEYLLAGMIDVPLLKGEYFCILDWKTNKNELRKTAGYYKKQRIGGVLVKTDNWVETGERFKYPLDMLEASKFNIYALQLSLYAYILEQWGYKLVEGGLEIIHFPIGKEPQLLKIPYLKEEVQLMLNHHKQTVIL